MQPDRLIDRQKLMKSILPESANAQPKIDLRERSDLYRHGSKIVSHPASRDGPLAVWVSKSEPELPLGRAGTIPRQI